MRTIGMSSQNYKKSNHSILRNNKGFTLIELAIVLVIIGLILGSVLKGKDLINSTKQKQFYSSFVKGWELSIISYYDRTGYLLGDGTVNGGSNATSDGWFDQINGTEFSDIEKALSEKGLEVPETNTGDSYKISYTGAYSGNQTITLYLYNRTDFGERNNILMLYNVPTDLAWALDKMIDGQVDPAKGKCVLMNGATGVTSWGDASTVDTVRMSIRLDIP